MLRIDDSEFCTLPILAHEPFNVKESWHVWNYTRQLLWEGSSFCTRPSAERASIFASWRARQARAQFVVSSWCSVSVKLV